MSEIVSGRKVALVLAGGNALGAYQAGVYQALHDHGVDPEWVVGTSIGAINGAIIAGNAPDRRLERLADLWCPASDRPGWADASDLVPDSWRRSSEALATFLRGRPGMFVPSPALLGGVGGSPSIYDTRPQVGLLSALVDFARLNGGVVRFGALAVDLDSGDEILFDTGERRVEADHIRASAAFPPAFPAVEVDERLYVDGGVSANLPLDPVLAMPGDRPVLCIAVDLLPTAAPRPRTLGEAVGRTQDLIFASQSRRSIAHWQARYARAGDDAPSVTLARLAYTDQEREVAGKAMDFSPPSTRARWDQGARDCRRLLERMARGRLAAPAPGLTLVGERD